MTVDRMASGGWAGEPRCQSVDPWSKKQCRHPAVHKGSCSAVRDDCDKTEYRWWNEDHHDHPNNRKGS